MNDSSRAGGCGSIRTAFATAEWFEAWIDAFGNDTAGIWRPAPGDGDDCAVAYCREHVRLGPALRIKAAVGATNDHTPRYDILGVPADPTALFERMLRELGVSLLRFDYLSHDSNLLDACRRAPPRLSYTIDFCEDSPYVDCDLDWNDYWAGLGSTRTLWARRERKLMSEEGTTFRCLADWNEVQPLLDRIYDVEASGWKGREGTAIRQSTATLHFYNRCIAQWAREGWLRLFTLSVGEDIVAFQINVLFRGVLFQLKVGYDERYAKLSPGQVLQLQILRWAFARPEVHVYDMLGGGGKAGATKRKWATAAEPLYSLTVFRRDLSGLLARVRLIAAPRVKRFLTGKPGKTHQPVPFPHKG